MNTREEWLIAALHLIAAHIDYATKGKSRVPQNTRVACGWGSGRKTLGECWSEENSADGTVEIFITPRMDDASLVLATLVHEACHAAVGVKHGHKAPFKQCALAVGLEGKMTATVAGEALRGLISGWIEQLGAYPHAALTPSDKKKQSTRLVKCQCDKCGYTVRTTAKWLDLSGTPFCPTDACRDEDDMPNRMTATVTETEGEE